jgi:hypothetical protein
MGGSLLSLIEIFYHFVIKKFFHPQEEETEEKSDLETIDSLLQDQLSIQKTRM